MSDVTQILAQIDGQNPAAAEKLLALVYQELRQLAAAQLAREKPGHTLQATALVHEAYLRLLGDDGGRKWNGGRHFFAAAAEAMRRILVDAARRKASEKHGGGHHRQSFEEAQIATDALPVEVLAVHEALDRLAGVDPVAAELVKLRYFGGFSLEEAAELLKLSRASAYRSWTYARAWLKAALS